MRGREWVRSVGGTGNKMFVAERGLTMCKSRNKSFLFGASTQHNNTRKTQQPDVGTTSTSCKFVGARKVGEWWNGLRFAILFYWYMWSSRARGFDAKMSSYTWLRTTETQQAATTSRTHTEQVTPSLLGFEASNPLKPLLLHYANVDFNWINKNWIWGSREMWLLG
jgi:hypothetical protein